MKTLQIKVKGIAPLIQHSDRAADPLGPQYKAMKPLTAKRNKTERDHADIGRLEWESGLYLHGGVVVVPGYVFRACLHVGAKRLKLGKKIEQSVQVLEEFMPLKYKGPKIKVPANGNFPIKELDVFYEQYAYRAMVKVAGSKTPRVRAIFHDWSFDTNLLYDSNEIDEHNLMLCCENAGRFAGLMDRRPDFGKFEIEKI